VLAVPEVPCPAPQRGEVLIQTRATLVSAGTERMLLEFGKANWIEKARQQPEKVRQVVDKMRTDGVVPTLNAVQAKLDQPVLLGYSNAGMVVDGDAYAPGTRVVSNGAHAEMVCVPKNLTAAIPSNVSDQEAAFTVVGAIALEGIRLLAPTLGETIAVSGLGLIGLMAVQLLRAHGCRVIGLDLDPSRLALAATFGAETIDLRNEADPQAAAERLTSGRGVDAVLIAAATPSDVPVHQAAQMCRKRGRIVLTGVTGLHLSRDDFYKKELTFQVSCSYGPGRYDPAYERHGQDYPVGYVRWTAQRNFEAVLQMMAEGRLNVQPLLTHRFPFARVDEAYALLESTEPYLGILLDYAERDPEELLRRTISIEPPRGAPIATLTDVSKPLAVGVIGAGGYATQVLLPALKQAGVLVASVVSTGGVNAQQAARKFGAAEASTDAAAILADPRITAVVIATRHDTHANYVCEALRAGKHVFVEKPLALRASDLEEIEKSWFLQPRILSVGFNRRFAPHAIEMRRLLSTTSAPKCVVVTVNAGILPGEHWTRDAELGGGRLIGEGCHFLDLARYLVGTSIVEARWRKVDADTATLEVRFEDRSSASIHYFANGHRSYPKERVQVFAGGRVLELDNWRKLRGFGWKGFTKMNLWRQDKGNAACVAAWASAISNGSNPPVPVEEILEVSHWTLLAARD
jgi:predicted dehydrogenase